MTSMTRPVAFELDAVPHFTSDDSILCSLRGIPRASRRSRLPKVPMDEAVILLLLLVIIVSYLMKHILRHYHYYYHHNYCYYHDYYYYYYYYCITGLLLLLLLLVITIVIIILSKPAPEGSPGQRRVAEDDPRRVASERVAQGRADS